MAKNGKNGMGGLLLLGASLAAFALLRQGQATANALTTARLVGFEPKGWKGTTLSGLAQVEFNNTDVTREVQVEKLGLNIVYNGTSLGTAHLVNGRALAANENTTLPIPVTLNIGALFTQLALTGKLPSLKTFTSAGKVLAWLQANIATEALRMQGTALVNGLQVSFDQELPLADYLPGGAPRPGPVEQLPGRQVTVRTNPTSTTQPGAAAPRQPVVRPMYPTSSTSPSTTSPSTTSTTRPGVTQPGRPRSVVKTVVKGGKVVQQVVPLARQAANVVRQAAGKRKARPALPSDLAVLREGAAQRVKAAKQKGTKTGGKRPANAGGGRPLTTVATSIPYS